MKARILTTEEIRSCEGREYNPEVWEENIDRMIKYSDVIFYHVPKGDGFDYDRYFVEYTLPEGLRLFRSFSYSGGISSGGFFQLRKFAETEDGKTMSDVLNMMKDDNQEGAVGLFEQLSASKLFNISYEKFTTKDGKTGVIDNSSEGREYMIIMSISNGMVFSKGM
jgi:hypothetical protein